LGQELTSCVIWAKGKLCTAGDDLDLQALFSQRFEIRGP